jgi:hypothetical protein
MKSSIIAVWIFLLSHAVYALSSSSSFVVSGRVPVVLQANVVRANDLNYTIREVSNNSEGYTIIMQTDARSARYNGSHVSVVNGEAVLTQVFSQDKSVDALKKLVFTTKPTYVRIAIQVM